MFSKNLKAYNALNSSGIPIHQMTLGCVSGLFHKLKESTYYELYQAGILLNLML